MGLVDKTAPGRDQDEDEDHAVLLHCQREQVHGPPAYAVSTSLEAPAHIDLDATLLDFLLCLGCGFY